MTQGIANFGMGEYLTDVVLLPAGRAAARHSPAAHSACTPSSAFR